MKKKNHSNEKLEAITFKTLIVGVDIAKHNQWARFVDCRGIEHDKALKFENNRNGFNANVAYNDNNRLSMYDIFRSKEV